MLKRYLYTSLKSKTTLLTIIAIICYAVIPLFNVNILALTSWEETPSFFNANYAGFFYIYSITFFIIPVYYIFLQSNRIFFDKDCVVIRLKKYWRLRTFIIAIESAEFVGCLYILMFIRAIYFRQMSNFLENGFFLLAAAFLQILGFYLLAMIYLFFSYITNNAVTGFVCSYIFVVYDYIARQTGVMPEIFVFRAIAITPDYMQGYLLNLILILFMDIVFYIFSFIFVSDRDRLPKKVT